MPKDIDQITDDIASLSPKAVLYYLVANGIKDFAEKGYDKLRHAITSRFDERHYAFVPDKKEAEALKDLSKNPSYQTVKSLIPKYSYIDMIRTGLLLKSYLDNPTKENDKRNMQIRRAVAIRPNGTKMTSLLHLTCTPYFSSVITYLIKLKNENGYSENQLLEKFEEIVNDWDECHLPVRSGDSIKAIREFCMKKMSDHKRNVFLIGLKEASRNIEQAVNELAKKNLFEKFGYECTILKTEGGIEPRIEVALRYRSESEEFFEPEDLKAT